MNAKWTVGIVAATVLVVLSSQVMAQPWNGGGRGQGFGRGQGMGPMAQGRGSMRQGMGRGGPQNGPGAWCPWGVGPRGQAAGNGLGLGQLGFGRQLAQRLGLTQEQVQKIHEIVAEARSRTLVAIKGVLTEDQAAQLDQMRERGEQRGQSGRGPAFQGGRGGPMGPRFQQGQGPRAQMGRQGQGPAGQPFMGGPGMGRGMGRRMGMNQATPEAQAPADEQNVNPEQGPAGQGPAGQPFMGGPGMGRGMRSQRRMNQPAPESQTPAAGPVTNRGQGLNRGVPPLEQMFEQADTNNDGALTREEIRAFHEKMGPRPGWQQQ